MYHLSKRFSGVGVVFLGSAMLVSCTNPHATRMDEGASFGRGADMHQRAHYGTTALHTAAWGGDALVVDALLNRRADVNSRDHTGVTALHIAEGRGNTAVVKTLLNW